MTELIQATRHTQKDLIVFDRGLKSRQTFRDFTNQNTKFVTRLSDKARYQVQKQHQPLPSTEHHELILLSDEIVYLFCMVQQTSGLAVPFGSSKPKPKRIIKHSFPSPMFSIFRPI